MVKLRSIFALVRICEGFHWYTLSHTILLFKKTAFYFFPACATALHIRFGIRCVCAMDMDVCVRVYVWLFVC